MTSDSAHHLCNELSRCDAKLAALAQYAIKAGACSLAVIADPVLYVLEGFAKALASPRRNGRLASAGPEQNLAARLKIQKVLQGLDVPQSQTSTDRKDQPLRF
mmetsp:Transcript_36119/g.67275  ORF Transcript_36119/g.67275 Transcript_36119/m.67275 type:complete len:103 (-) Transcript_36119:158-466(-)